MAAPHTPPPSMAKRFLHAFFEASLIMFLRDVARCAGLHVPRFGTYIVVAIVLGWAASFIAERPSAAQS